MHTPYKYCDTIIPIFPQLRDNHDDIPDVVSILEYAENGSLYSYLHDYGKLLDFKNILEWASDIALGMYIVVHLFYIYYFCNSEAD